MEIEETIARRSYRSFDITHLQHGKATPTRWHISRQESGMNRHYGYAASEGDAKTKIDSLLQ